MSVFSFPAGRCISKVLNKNKECGQRPTFRTLCTFHITNLKFIKKTIDVLESDYVRFARARGLSTWGALRHHGLRNLALPALTLQFASISEIFGGSVLVEQVFSYPGLGQAAVTAGLGGDAALLVGIALFSAAFVFTGNLIASTLYGVVDPRMRKGAAHG